MLSETGPNCIKYTQAVLNKSLLTKDKRQEIQRKLMWLQHTVKQLKYTGVRITDSVHKPQHNTGLTGVPQQSIKYEPTRQDKQSKPSDKTAVSA